MSETKREVYEALLEAAGYGDDSLNDEERAEWMKRYDAAEEVRTVSLPPLVNTPHLSPLARDRGWPGDDGDNVPTRRPIIGTSTTDIAIALQQEYDR